LTEFIESSNPNGFETANLCSVFDAELCLLIVISEIDPENSQHHERLAPGRRFKKNSIRENESAGRKGVGNGGQGAEARKLVSLPNFAIPLYPFPFCAFLI
jgi:hypothetical protein